MTPLDDSYCADLDEWLNRGKRDLRWCVAILGLVPVFALLATWIVA